MIDDPAMYFTIGPLGRDDPLVAAKRGARVVLLQDSCFEIRPRAFAEPSPGHGQFCLRVRVSSR